MSNLLEMKPTITDLAKYLGRTQVGLSKMKKNHPKLFELVMIGFIEKIKESKK